MCNGSHAAFDKAMLANFVDPARNSGYNLHIEVFSIGLFMEKKVLLLSVTTPCMRCGNHFDTYGHVWSVPGRANVPPASRPMSPRSIVITLTCINGWSASPQQYQGLREAGSGNDALLDSH